MITEYSSVASVVAILASRCRQLADMSMNELRMVNGYGCDTEFDCREKDRGKTRGQIIEEILIEEFDVSV